MSAITCPYCRLPALGVGHAIAASNADDTRHGAVRICRRCSGGWALLPPKTQRRGLRAAVERALDDPAKYGVRLFPDPGAAQLAVALLGHPKFVARTMEAIGW